VTLGAASQHHLILYVGDIDFESGLPAAYVVQLQAADFTNQQNTKRRIHTHGLLATLSAHESLSTDCSSFSCRSYHGAALRSGETLNFVLQPAFAT